MDRSVLQYYGFTITLLSSIGLWPYQNENLRRFMNPTITLLLTIVLIPQLTPFATQKFEMIIFLKNMWSIIVSLGSLSKYIAFWQHAEKLKAFMEDVIHDWNTMDDEELKILKEYAYTGRRYSTIFALFTYPAIFLTMVSHFTSELLDIVAPLNVTRPHVSPIVSEYFIDEQKYFFLIASYQSLMIILIGTTFIATESIITMWIQHIASLFIIVCYRMREAILDSIPVSGVHGKQFHAVNKYKLIKSVILHRRVLKSVLSETKYLLDLLPIFGGTVLGEVSRIINKSHGYHAIIDNFAHFSFSTDLMSTVAISYSLLLILGVLSQSIVLFRLSQSIFLVNRMAETLQSIIMIIAILVYMFYINFVVQQAVDCGNNIFTFLYSTDWYRTSISTQKMLLFIMSKSSRVINMNILFVYNPSIEGFAILLKTSLSYFMMMYSSQ